MSKFATRHGAAALCGLCTHFDGFIQLLGAGLGHCAGCEEELGGLSTIQKVGQQERRIACRVQALNVCVAQYMWTVGASERDGRVVVN